MPVPIKIKILDRQTKNSVILKQSQIEIKDFN